jgi:hypothetical protein
VLCTGLGYWRIWGIQAQAGDLTHFVRNANQAVTSAACLSGYAFVDAFVAAAADPWHLVL